MCNSMSDSLPTMHAKQSTLDPWAQLHNAHENDPPPTTKPLQFHIPPINSASIIETAPASHDVGRLLSGDRQRWKGYWWKGHWGWPFHQYPFHLCLPKCLLLLLTSYMYLTLIQYWCTNIHVHCYLACSEEKEQMSMGSEEWRRERFQREEFLQQQVGFIVFKSLILATDNNVLPQQSRSPHSLVTEEDQSVLSKTVSQPTLGNIYDFHNNYYAKITNSSVYLCLL